LQGYRRTSPIGDSQSTRPGLQVEAASNFEEGSCRAPRHPSGTSISYHLDVQCKLTSQFPQSFEIAIDLLKPSNIDVTVSLWAVNLAHTLCLVTFNLLARFLLVMSDLADHDS
jgi:hypothetical protein